MEVIAFANGDSRKASTWSNIPYFFLKALEDNDPNIQIHRYNIRLQDESNLLSLIGRIYNKFARKIMKAGGVLRLQ